MKRLRLFAAMLFICLGGLRAEVSLFLSDCVAQRGDSAVVGLYVSDASVVTAFQVDISLPQGAVLLKAELSPKETGHTFMAKSLEGNVVRVGGWSAANATLQATSGPVATLTLLFPTGMLGGTYSLETQSATVVYPNGGKHSLASTAATAWVSTEPEWTGRALLFTDWPVAQAYSLQNTTSSRWLTLDSASGKASIDNQSECAGAQFFLEPAFDAGEECYYLRSASGLYLNLARSGSTVRIGTSRNPSKEAAVRLVLTGERAYALRQATGGQPLGTASTAAGASLTMKVDGANTQWRLLPAEAAWPGEGLKHMAATAESCVDLTKGEADLALRMAIHWAKRAAEEQADGTRLNELTVQLMTAVAEARAAQARGDASVASAPWGSPEAVPTVDYVVSVTDNEGHRRFLTMEEGQPVLTDLLTVCDMPIRDLFYNPYTDRYALRLQGEEVYLAFDSATGRLERVDGMANEALRVWQVQTLTEALSDGMERTGACGPKAKWRFDADTRTLFIAGSERTAYYASADETPWNIYRHLIRRAVVAGDFQKLGSYLLAGCSSLERLTFTTQTPPSIGTGAFENVPTGLEIRALTPEAYADFLPGCSVKCIASLADTYRYCGQAVTPKVECDFETAVSTTGMQTAVGSYNTTASLRIYIEETSCSLTLPFAYTILPASLVATTRAYSRNYGAKNPSLSVSFEGLVGDDKLTDVVEQSPVASCAADKKSPVGVYEIVLSGGSLRNANYTLVLQPSALTVNPARLTVRVQDATRSQDEPNPTFTCTYSGFVNGEDESVILVKPTISTDADEHAAPGLYDIVASGGEAPNYDMRYVTGILTVTPGTGVPTIKEEASEAPEIFDLQGRPVDRNRDDLPPGLYIVGGKKVWIR